MKKYILSFLFKRGTYNFFLALMLFSSCSDFLDVGTPPDKVVGEYVYEHNSSAIAVLNGLFYDIQSDDGIVQGRSGVAFNVGLSGDEFEIPGVSLYKKVFSNNDFPKFWQRIYGFVYRCNDSIEGLATASLLKPTVKRQLMGEALFMRAFCYFYLVNLYGDVPLVISTEYKLNASLGRATKETVYGQIIDDLLKAEDCLSEQFLGSDLESISNERTRPSKWAAYALLARAYLFSNRWEEAEKVASLIIEQKQMFDTVPLTKVFLKNSNEAIWQIQPISSDGAFLHVRDAELYILLNGAPGPFDNPVVVGEFLKKEFDTLDRRQYEWIKDDSSSGKKYSYFFKYKIKDPEVEVGEYLMIFRLAEQYLIRAEARAQQNNLISAQLDINIIRVRAGLSRLSLTDKNLILNAILKERQLELFTEGGHRWLDLKRVGKIDDVMMEVCPKKGGTWATYKQLYPLPVSELQYNKNLRQNDGYPSM